LKKWIPYLLLGAMAIAVLLIKVFKKSNLNQANPTSQSTNRNNGFDRRTSFIEYTQHAKCRMECRHITEAEVQEIMKEGTINYRKSEVNKDPCPVYALEGTTMDNQRVRIVYAQCDYKTKVVTVIDLDTNWECHCPGDDDQYKNKNQ
jgi:hypothetical protein